MKVFNLHQVCELLADNAERYWDSEQEVPYLVKDNLWVGYDDPQSISLKVSHRSYWYKEKEIGTCHKLVI